MQQPTAISDRNFTLVNRRKWDGKKSHSNLQMAV
jgi:hypothetical protein